MLSLCDTHAQLAPPTVIRCLWHQRHDAMQLTICSHPKCPACETAANGARSSPPAANGTHAVHTALGMQLCVACISFLLNQPGAANICILLMCWHATQLLRTARAKAQGTHAAAMYIDGGMSPGRFVSPLCCCTICLCTPAHILRLLPVPITLPGNKACVPRCSDVSK
jgi:hypothetical protein